MTKYFIVPIYGCTDPEPVVGPYTSYDSMLRRARKIRAKQKDSDAIFWMVTKGGNRPMVMPFRSGDLE